MAGVKVTLTSGSHHLFANADDWRLRGDNPRFVEVVRRKDDGKVECLAWFNVDHVVFIGDM